LRLIASFITKVATITIPRGKVPLRSDPGCCSGSRVRPVRRRRD
jgi:hypothetical protein